MGVKRHEKLSGANFSSSADNTYILGCGALNRRCHYSICVHFLIAVEEKRIGESFPDCQAALRRGECQAFKMREEEKKKGESIYYVKRKERIKAPEERPVVRHKRPTPIKIAKPTPNLDDEMIGADMSAVITHAVKEESKPVLIKPRFDEDPIQFAKRYLRESR
ncbi:hypothetical protein KI655_18500 [Vibrio sp. D404a]|uniref:hypothetical protein n=1 Tax=unclassified Vibrio TaxID=2614977 RepID=UPI0025565B7C|nr:MULTISPECIES: hypothetical protein [unclassified Vibrio]MDK9739289.1 hypothetical protein [Vibrio sp. D404a]MDK9797675.1 hypothetical protein [Vibrio sp. D449a]